MSTTPPPVSLADWCGGSPEDNARDKARALVVDILRDVDVLLPELIGLLANDQLVPADDADDDRLRVFLERLQPAVSNVLNLRMMSLEPRKG